MQNVKYKKIGVRDFSKNVSVVGYDDILSPDTDQVLAADLFSRMSAESQILVSYTSLQSNEKYSLA